MFVVWHEFPSDIRRVGAIGEGAEERRRGGVAEGGQGAPNAPHPLVDFFVVFLSSGVDSLVAALPYALPQFLVVEVSGPLLTGVFDQADFGGRSGCRAPWAGRRQLNISGGEAGAHVSGTLQCTTLSFAHSGHFKLLCQENFLCV